MIVGDVVLIKDENLLGNQWCFGCIYECYIDNDGYVWKVKFVIVSFFLNKYGKW